MAARMTTAVTTVTAGGLKFNGRANKLTKRLLSSI